MTQNRAVGFSVEVEPETFELSRHHAITGNIWLNLGARAFPEKHWNDFPVVILGWWLRGALSVLDSPTGVALCSFMDGPFAFEMRPSGGSWEFGLLKDRRATATSTVAREVAIDAYLSATATVIRVCRDRGWKPRDLEELQAAENGLRRAWAARAR